ncbi:MAG: hypothetical protein ACE5K8_04505 [Candidatus Zixiibacteriota bacterium]
MTSKTKRANLTSAFSRRKQKGGGPPVTTSAGMDSPAEELHQNLAELTETNQRLRRKIFDLYTIFELSRNFGSVLSYDDSGDCFEIRLPIIGK